MEESMGEWAPEVGWGEASGDGGGASGGASGAEAWLEQQLGRAAMLLGESSSGSSDDVCAPTRRGGSSGGAAAAGSPSPLRVVVARGDEAGSSTHVAAQWVEDHLPSDGGGAMGVGAQHAPSPGPRQEGGEGMGAVDVAQRALPQFATNALRSLDRSTGLAPQIALTAAMGNATTTAATAAVHQMQALLARQPKRASTLHCAPRREALVLRSSLSRALARARAFALSQHTHAHSLTRFRSIATQTGTEAEAKRLFEAGREVEHAASLAARGALERELTAQREHAAAAEESLAAESAGTRRAALAREADDASSLAEYQSALRRAQLVCAELEVSVASGKSSYDHARVALERAEGDSAAARRAHGELQRSVDKRERAQRARIVELETQLRDLRLSEAAARAQHERTAVLALVQHEEEVAAMRQQAERRRAVAHGVAASTAARLLRRRPRLLRHALSALQRHSAAAALAGANVDFAQQHGEDAAELRAALLAARAAEDAAAATEADYAQQHGRDETELRAAMLAARAAEDAAAAAEADYAQQHGRDATELRAALLAARAAEDAAATAVADSAARAAILAAAPPHHGAAAAAASVPFLDSTSEALRPAPELEVDQRVPYGAALEGAPETLAERRRSVLARITADQWRARSRTAVQRWRRAVAAELSSVDLPTGLPPTRPLVSTATVIVCRALDLVRQDQPSTPPTGSAAMRASPAYGGESDRAGGAAGAAHARARPLLLTDENSLFMRVARLDAAMGRRCNAIAD
jgi:hypothetical protein